MLLLCGVSNWEESVTTKGRGVGSKIVRRKVVAADNWNWIAGEQRGGKDTDKIYPEGFYPSLRQLLPVIGQEGAVSVMKALQVMTGRTLEAPIENLGEYGKNLDDLLDASYGCLKEYPPTVLKRIFKSTDTDSE